MKISCGTDIIEIKRIKENISKNGEKFINRIFTENEIKYFETRKTEKYKSYAGRFAAKEAIYKAISENLKDEKTIGWKDIEIVNKDSGKPEVEFKNIEIKNINYIDVSISHCKEYATATAVISYKE